MIKCPVPKNFSPFSMYANRDRKAGLKVWSTKQSHKHLRIKYLSNSVNHSIPERDNNKCIDRSISTHVDSLSLSRVLPHLQLASLRIQDCVQINSDEVKKRENSSQPGTRTPTHTHALPSPHAHAHTHRGSVGFGFNENDIHLVMQILTSTYNFLA